MLVSKASPAKKSARQMRKERFAVRMGNAFLKTRKLSVHVPMAGVVILAPTHVHGMHMEQSVVVRASAV
jgi:hypothetical protein